jgi:hypothetical protein
VTDTATLAGGQAPGGSITFVLYAAGDTTCAAPVFTSDAIAVSGNGAYTSSPAFVPPAVGTYRWRAFYSGDGSNAAIAGACGASRESVTIAKATPALSTLASAGGALGVALTDQAVLSGASPGGTLRFRLYGPDDATCANAPRFTSAVVTVNGNGTYVSTPAFTPAVAGAYRWRASYSGDASNAAVTGPCNDTGENVTVAQATPTLATSASPGGVIGTSLTDQATLAGGLAPTGSITFNVYGPGDTSCTAPPAFTAAVAVAGNGVYASPPFAPPAIGSYRWVAVYGGDANNAAVSGTCGDAAESATIVLAVPVLATTASAGGTLGVALTDQATLGGGLGPTGTIAFNAYGPDDATCAGAPAFTSTTVVAGTGTYASGAFTPGGAGTWRWRAFYSGDARNVAAAGACNDAGESAVVARVVPTLVTSASPAIALGATITDTATLAAGAAPTGTITFRAYGPGDAGCAGTPALTSTSAVSGNGTYTSSAFTPTSAGTWRFVASYGGDANNQAASGACGAAGESVAVGVASPTLVTQASAGGAIGVALSDAATLAGGFHPTGAVTFVLYGPDDASCANAAAFTSRVTVDDNGTYTSATFTPTVAGTYRWRASYGGDAGNTAVAGACDDPAESATIASAQPTLAARALPPSPLELGASIRDTATLAGGHAPTGAITFDLYPPDDPACAGAPPFTSTIAVDGEGDYTSASFVPPTAGEWRWIARYGGDRDNAPVATDCADPRQAVRLVARPESPRDVDTLAPAMMIALVLALAGLAGSRIARPRR